MTPVNDGGVTADNSHAAKTAEIVSADSSQPAVRYLWILTVIFWGGMFISISGIIRQVILMWSQP